MEVENDRKKACECALYDFCSGATFASDYVYVGVVLNIPNSNERNFSSGETFNVSVSVALSLCLES